MFDKARVDEFLDMLDVPDVKELYDDYEQDGLETISKIEAALSSSDNQKLKNEVHSLKGSSANVGAQAVFELCNKADSQLKSNLLSDVKVTLDNLTTVFDKTITEIKKYLS